MTGKDRLQMKFHIVSFTVKVVLITYYVFIGIQFLFLNMMGEDAAQGVDTGFYGHNYCGTFFIDITMENSFTDRTTFLKWTESVPDPVDKAVVSAASQVLPIILLLIFLNRADKQTISKKRSAWLMILAGIIFAAGNTYLELDKLYPDNSGLKGVMATQSYYPQIIYAVYGVAAIVISYGLILLLNEQKMRGKSTAAAAFFLKMTAFLTVVVSFCFMLSRLGVRVYEIIGAKSGEQFNARLPFYSVMLDLPMSDAVSPQDYVKVLAFRLAKDMPVFAAAAFAVIMLVKVMLDAAKGEINTNRNRMRLKVSALALMSASIIFNILGVVETEMLRMSFTGIYAATSYTIGVRSGCEPMLYALLLIAAEVYLKVIPETENNENVKTIKVKSLEKPTRLNGTKEEKVMQCLKKAGWHKGRCADISEVEAWYSRWNITLSEPIKDIFREYYGLAEEWQFNADPGENDKHGVEFEFFLLPGISGENYLSDIDSSGKFARQKAVEEAVGEPLVFIGQVGCDYPDFLFASQSGEIWTASGRKHKDMFRAVMHHFANCEQWHSVKMRQYEEWK